MLHTLKVPYTMRLLRRMGVTLYLPVNSEKPLYHPHFMLVIQDTYRIGREDYARGY